MNALESILLRLTNAIEQNNRLLSMSVPQYFTTEDMMERWKLSRTQVKLLIEQHQINVIRTGHLNRIPIKEVCRLDSILRGGGNVSFVTDDAGAWRSQSCEVVAGQARPATRGRS